MWRGRVACIQYPPTQSGHRVVPPESGCITPCATLRSARAPQSPHYSSGGRAARVVERCESGGRYAVVWNRRYEPEGISVDTRVKAELNSWASKRLAQGSSKAYRVSTSKPFKVFTASTSTACRNRPHARACAPHRVGTKVARRRLVWLRSNYRRFAGTGRSGTGKLANLPPGNVGPSNHRLVDMMTRATDPRLMASQPQSLSAFRSFRLHRLLLPSCWRKRR